MFSLKVGLEQEFFCVSSGENNTEIPNLVPKAIPYYDDCGWLFEARGNPSRDIIDAIFSLKAAVYRLDASIAAYNRNKSADNPELKKGSLPFMTIERDLKVAAARKFSKGLIRYRNLYGHEHHRTRNNEFTAGIHISFTNPTEVRNEDKRTVTVNGMFDFNRLFSIFDKEFSTEIREAKRNPGFYEIKGDGRIEYRSLPNTVNLEKVISVVNEAILQL
jgi:hypothetical protein